MRNSDGALAGSAAPQQDCHELGVRQRLGAMAQQTLARTLGPVDLADG